MFTPDATYNFVTGSTDNLEALKNTIRDALQPLSSSQHINANQWAEIEGDRATAGCYFTVHMYKEGLADGEHFEMGGRYEDELIRTLMGGVYKQNHHHPVVRRKSKGAMARLASAAS